ncbi:MAG: hypothetical protein IT160_10910 [Bryobacterales bacterium]|nr:hypothetical protein [Bryobacterales bacterium]
MNHQEPFVFYTERRLVALTGMRARTLAQLVGHLGEISGSSIFYHTHQMYLAHHFETPVFSNDFALWVGGALQQEALGEKLAAVDLLSFTSIRQLREEIIRVIERHMAAGGWQDRECPPGDEFHFCRSKSFIMPTGLEARDPDEFFEILPRVSNLSLFFHFFESRLRLGHATNDFSEWLAGRGETGLAQAIDEADPYIMTLDQFKQRIIMIGKSRS